MDAATGKKRLVREISLAPQLHGVPFLGGIVPFSWSFTYSHSCWPGDPDPARTEPKVTRRNRHAWHCPHVYMMGLYCM